ncbi:MAG: hypothetical protein GX303_06235 [Clostridiales bacterium]|nr:hypothetical protein [Clostridiales bacterium]
MKQLRFFLLALLIIVSLAACIQNTGPHKGEGIPLTTTYPQQKGSEIITTFDSSYITAITYPPETDSSVTEGSVTDPPVDELVIPNTIILEPFPGNPLENFIPTSIVDYNDLTVISDGIISYICTPKGEVIYIVEGTVQRCRHCGVIYYQYHIGFNIRLEQDGKYRFYPHQNYGHGDGRGAYVYDITEKMVYSISAVTLPLQ